MIQFSENLMESLELLSLKELKEILQQEHVRCDNIKLEITQLQKEIQDVSRRNEQDEQMQMRTLLRKIRSSKAKNDEIYVAEKRKEQNMIDFFANQVRKAVKESEEVSDVMSQETRRILELQQRRIDDLTLGRCNIELCKKYPLSTNSIVVDRSKVSSQLWQEYEESERKRIQSKEALIKMKVEKEHLETLYIFLVNRLASMQISMLRKTDAPPGERKRRYSSVMPAKKHAA